MAYRQTSAPVSEFKPTTPKVATHPLEQLEVPDDAHLPAAQRQELKLELLRKALAAAPADIALNEAYQKVRLGGMEVNRPDLISEYEQLLAKHPIPVSCTSPPKRKWAARRRRRLPT